jgi:AbiJ-like protein
MGRKLPADNKKRNLVILGIKKAIHATFDESAWKELGYRTGTQDWIKSHGRLLRSLSWGDEDYEGHVLDAIEHILEADPANLDELLDTPSIAQWLKQNDPPALANVLGGGGGVEPAVAQPA